MLIRIVGIVFPIFAVVAVGYVYGRLKRPDLTTVNRLNTDVLLPALIFFVLSSKDFAVEQYGWLALGGAIVVLGSGLLALPVARLARVPALTFVPPMMFNNSGNMGLPLAVLAFGAAALPAAVMLFIVSNVLHFTVGTRILAHRASWLEVARQPVVLASLAGFGFSVSGYTLVQPVNITLEMIGQASIPLLLFALGTRLVDIDLREWRVGLLGAVVCPATGVLIVLVLRPLLALPPEQEKLLLVFGALPPAVLNYLFAERYRQEPGKVAAIVMLGNLAAIVTLPIVLSFVLGDAPSPTLGLAR